MAAEALVDIAADGVALAVPGLPAGSTKAARRAAEKVVSKGSFTSTDKHVTDVANAIENAYPGHVIGVNVPFKRADGSMITDADILTKNAIIQVKSSQVVGKGLVVKLKGQRLVPVFQQLDLDQT